MYNNIKIMWVSTLISLLCSGLCTALIFNNNALVPSLIRHLDIHHISFIKSDEDSNNHDFLQLQKSLSESMPWLYFSVVSYLGITSMIESEFSRGFNSLVVLYENETSFDRLDLIDVTINVDISSVKWVLITDSFNLEEYRDMKIPYNCDFMVAFGTEDAGYEIIEMYDTTNIKKLRNYLGKWSPSDGLVMADDRLFSRRGNLQGSVFNISSNQKSNVCDNKRVYFGMGCLKESDFADPCSIQSFESSAGSVLMCIHYRLFHIMGQRHNFSINWLPQKTDAFRSTFLPKYLSDTIQFTIFEVNTKPKEGTTVIWPTTTTPVEVYASYTGRAFGWSTYLYPFSKEMWLAVFLWIIISSAIISVIQFSLTSENREEKWLCFAMWLQYTFLAFSAFCYQNEGVEPKRMSLRILLYLIFLIPTVLMPGYSAALTSYLTVKVEQAPFTTIEELSVAKDYKLGHIASFNLSLFLDKNSEDKVIRRLYRDILLPPNNMPIKESDGVQRMCKEKFSYLCTIYTVIAVPPQCSYFSLDRPLVVAMSMMPVKVDNPFKGLIRRSLRNFIYNGVFFVEAVRVLPRAVTNPLLDDDDAELDAVQFENIVAIIVVLGLGILLSLTLFFFELVSFTLNPTNFNKIILPY